MDEYKYIGKCKQCDKDFRRKSAHHVMCPKCIKLNEKPHACICNKCGKFFNSAKVQKFCSLKCKDKDQTKRITITCSNCGKLFEKTPSGITKENFCKQSCHLKFVRKNIKSDRIGISLKHFEILTKKYSNKCVICERVNEKMYPLNVHHLDSNPLNPKIKNLTLLCVRCHKLVSIYNRKGMNGMIQTRNRISRERTADVQHKLELDKTNKVT
jgi:hypothetical protein